jgi:hypothetical protein
MDRRKSELAELTALCERVRQWRVDSGGGRGKPVPEPVWQEAARVAQLAGVYATAQATRLNSMGLKERLHAAGLAAAPGPSGTKQRTAAVVPRARPRRVTAEAGRGGPGEGGTSSGPRFVALAVSPPSSAPQATVEGVGRDGERMRLEVSEGLDIVGLMQTFWRRASGCRWCRR